MIWKWRDVPQTKHSIPWDGSARKRLSPQFVCRGTKCQEIVGIGIVNKLVGNLLVVSNALQMQIAQTMAIPVLMISVRITTALIHLNAQAIKYVVRLIMSMLTAVRHLKHRPLAYQVWKPVVAQKSLPQDVPLDSHLLLAHQVWSLSVWVGLIV